MTTSNANWWQILIHLYICIYCFFSENSYMLVTLTHEDLYLFPERCWQAPKLAYIVLLVWFHCWAYDTKSPFSFSFQPASPVCLFATNIGGVPFCSYSHRANVYVYYIKVHLFFSQLSPPPPFLACCCHELESQRRQGGAFNTVAMSGPQLTNVYRKCFLSNFLSCPVNFGGKAGYRRSVELAI